MEIFRYVRSLPLSLKSHLLTELSWDKLSKLDLEYSESFSSLPSGKPGVRNNTAVDRLVMS